MNPLPASSLSCWRAALFALSLVFAWCARAADSPDGFRPLFPRDGVPRGWVVRAWDDVSKPGPEGAVWKVIDGVLHGSEPRGTWLVSEKEYADFVLKYEFRLGERGNSGCGLRIPAAGDPAFDGLELQMVDPRYYPPDFGVVPPSELTGGLYRAVAPSAQLFKPTDWNSYEITCQGSRVTVILNGQQILDYDLDQHTTIVKRHDNTEASALKDRPRKGHIGFQELSRGGAHVEIRNAQIKELSPEAASVPIQPGADGVIVLHSRQAVVHGAVLRYEPQTNKITLGYWTRRDDWAGWNFSVPAPGAYQVEALQGCGPGSGGSEVLFSVGDQKIKMTVQETKHFQDFIPRVIGTIKLDRAGAHELQVRPQTKPGPAVMDLRQVRLIPIAAP